MSSQKLDKVYKYTNKGQTYEFDLDELTDEELEKFERMTEKQRMRFITTFEIKKQNVFPNSVSLRSRTTEDKYSKYNDIQIYDNKLREVQAYIKKLEKLGFTTSDAERVSLTDEDGKLINKYLDSFQAVDKDDIEATKKAFDLKDDISLGMLEKYFKQKLEKLNLSDENQTKNILENLRRLFDKKFIIDPELDKDLHELLDEEMETLIKNVKPTLDPNNVFSEEEFKRINWLNSDEGLHIEYEVDKYLDLIKSYIKKHKDEFEVIKPEDIKHMKGFTKIEDEEGEKTKKPKKDLSCSFVNLWNYELDKLNIEYGKTVFELMNPKEAKQMKDDMKIAQEGTQQEQQEVAEDIVQQVNNDPNIPAPKKQEINKIVKPKVENPPDKKAAPEVLPESQDTKMKVVSPDENPTSQRTETYSQVEEVKEEQPEQKEEEKKEENKISLKSQLNYRKKMKR